jgi:uncharacterized membrane protein YbhN (UPF0104 family)
MSLNGAIFVCVFTLLGGEPAMTGFTLVYSGAISAFLAGLVTPGSPSGIGVREAALFFILQGMSDNQIIIPAVLLWRVITITGDVLCFLLSKTCASRTVSSEQAKEQR